MVTVLDFSFLSLLSADEEHQNVQSAEMAE